MSWPIGICLPYGSSSRSSSSCALESAGRSQGASGTGTAGYRYALTDPGRDRARRYFEATATSGPAPVPLAQYTALMNALREQKHDVDPRARRRRASRI